MESEDSEYENFLDIDDNDIFIRKYSDDNIPIYNKRLSPSPDIIRNEKQKYHTYNQNTLYPFNIICGLRGQLCYILPISIIIYIMYHHLIHYH